MPTIQPTNPIAAPRAVRPTPPRRTSSGNSLMFSLEIGAGPVPPGIVGRTLAPPCAGQGVNALTYSLDQYRLTTSPENRSPTRAHRAPSPLPPPMKEPLPSEIESMSLRLSALVLQSNAYVAGLKNRLDAVEEFRTNWGHRASREQLTVFLEAQIEFASLDVDRLYSFQLPLDVWQRVANQVLRDHPDRPDNMGSILYWRGRAEAESLGFLHSDRRSSSSSSQQAPSAQESRRPSAASVLSVASLCSQPSPPMSEGLSSRRSSAPAGPYQAPRRRSGNDVSQSTIAE